MCKDTWFVTLTYGGGYDNPEAYTLLYHHVQKTLKRLRNNGFRFKYVAVGEYGTERERAHWHLIIFWETDPPRAVMDARIAWTYVDGKGKTKQYWEHGYTQLERPRSAQGASAYLMGYLDKAASGDTILKYSKRPAIGEKYLIEYARERAREGVAIFPDGDKFTVQGNTYIPHGAKDGKKKLFWYRVGRDTTMYSKMMTAYVCQWQMSRPEQRIASSADLEEWLQDVELEADRYDLRIQQLLCDQRDLYPNTFTDMPNEDYTVFTFGNMYVEYRPRACVLGVTKDGQTIWRARFDVEKSVTDVSNEHELERACWQGAQYILQNLPERIRKQAESPQVLDPPPN